MLGIGRLARLWERRGSLESFATTTRHAGDPTVRGDEGRRHFRITRRARGNYTSSPSQPSAGSLDSPLKLMFAPGSRYEQAARGWQVARRLATCVSRPVSSSRRELPRILRKLRSKFYRPPRGRRRRGPENCRNLRRMFADGVGIGGLARATLRRNFLGTFAGYKNLRPRHWMRPVLEESVSAGNRGNPSGSSLSLSLFLSAARVRYSGIR